MVCNLKPGLLSKGWAGSHFIDAVHIPSKGNSTGLLQLLKQDQRMLVPFLLLSAAFTIPGLLPNTLKLISCITSKAEVSIVNKA